MDRKAKTSSVRLSGVFDLFSEAKIGVDHHQGLVDKSERVKGGSERKVSLFSFRNKAENKTSECQKSRSKNIFRHLSKSKQIPNLSLDLLENEPKVQPQIRTEEYLRILNKGNNSEDELEIHRRPIPVPERRPRPAERNTKIDVPRPQRSFSLDVTKRQARDKSVQYQHLHISELSPTKKKTFTHMICKRPRSLWLPSKNEGVSQVTIGNSREETYLSKSPEQIENKNKNFRKSCKVVELFKDKGKVTGLSRKFEVVPSISQSSGTSNKVDIRLDEYAKFSQEKDNSTKERSHYEEKNIIIKGSPKERAMLRLSGQEEDNPEGNSESFCVAKNVEILSELDLTCRKYVNQTKQNASQDDLVKSNDTSRLSTAKKIILALKNYVTILFTFIISVPYRVLACLKSVIMFIIYICNKIISSIKDLGRSTLCRSGLRLGSTSCKKKNCALQHNLQSNESHEADELDNEISTISQSKIANSLNSKEPNKMGEDLSRDSTRVVCDQEGTRNDSVTLRKKPIEEKKKQKRWTFFQQSSSEEKHKGHKSRPLSLPNEAVISKEYIPSYLEPPSLPDAGTSKESIPSCLEPPSRPELDTPQNKTRSSDCSVKSFAKKTILILKTVICCLYNLIMFLPYKLLACFNCILCFFSHICQAICRTIIRAIRPSRQLKAFRLSDRGEAEIEIPSIASVETEKLCKKKEKTVSFFRQSNETDETPKLKSKESGTKKVLQVEKCSNNDTEELHNGSKFRKKWIGLLYRMKIKSVGSEIKEKQNCSFRSCSRKLFFFFERMFNIILSSVLFLPLSVIKCLKFACCSMVNVFNTGVLVVSEAFNPNNKPTTGEGNTPMISDEIMNLGKRTSRVSRFFRQLNESSKKSKVKPEISCPEVNKADIVNREYTPLTSESKPEEVELNEVPKTYFSYPRHCIRKLTMNTVRFCSFIISCVKKVLYSIARLFSFTISCIRKVITSIALLIYSITTGIISLPFIGLALLWSVVCFCGRIIKTGFISVKRNVRSDKAKGKEGETENNDADDSRSLEKETPKLKPEVSEQLNQQKEEKQRLSGLFGALKRRENSPKSDIGLAMSSSSEVILQANPDLPLGCESEKIVRRAIKTRPRSLWFPVSDEKVSREKLENLGNLANTDSSLQRENNNRTYQASTKSAELSEIRLFSRGRDEISVSQGPSNVSKPNKGLDIVTVSTRDVDDGTGEKLFLKGKKSPNTDTEFRQSSTEQRSDFDPELLCITNNVEILKRENLQDFAKCELRKRSHASRITRFFRQLSEPDKKSKPKPVTTTDMCSPEVNEDPSFNNEECTLSSCQSIIEQEGLNELPGTHLSYRRHCIGKFTLCIEKLCSFITLCVKKIILSITKTFCFIMACIRKVITFIVWLIYSIISGIFSLPFIALAVLWSVVCSFGRTVKRGFISMKKIFTSEKGIKQEEKAMADNCNDADKLENPEPKSLEVPPDENLTEEQKKAKLSGIDLFMNSKGEEMVTQVTKKRPRSLWFLPKNEKASHERSERMNTLTDIERPLEHMQIKCDYYSKCRKIPKAPELSDKVIRLSSKDKSVSPISLSSTTPNKSDNSPHECNDVIRDFSQLSETNAFVTNSTKPCPMSRQSSTEHSDCIESFCTVETIVTLREKKSQDFAKHKLGKSSRASRISRFFRQFSETSRISKTKDETIKDIYNLNVNIDDAANSKDTLIPCASKSKQEELNEVPITPSFGPRYSVRKFASCIGRFCSYIISCIRKVLISIAWFFCFLISCIRKAVTLTVWTLYSIIYCILSLPFTALVFLWSAVCLFGQICKRCFTSVKRKTSSEKVKRDEAKEEEKVEEEAAAAAAAAAAVAAASEENCDNTETPENQKPKLRRLLKQLSQEKEEKPELPGILSVRNKRETYPRCSLNPTELSSFRKVNKENLNAMASCYGTAEDSLLTYGIKRSRTAEDSLATYDTKRSTMAEDSLLRYDTKRSSKLMDKTQKFFRQLSHPNEKTDSACLLFSVKKDADKPSDTKPDLTSSTKKENTKDRTLSFSKKSRSVKTPQQVHPRERFYDPRPYMRRIFTFLKVIVHLQSIFISTSWRRVKSSTSSLFCKLASVLKRFLSFLVQLTPRKVFKWMMVWMCRCLPDLKGRPLVIRVLRATPSRVSKKVVETYLKVVPSSVMFSHAKMALKNTPLKKIKKKMPKVWKWITTPFQIIFMAVSMILAIIPRALRLKK